jgi:periplasmic divalent cation tolerance protein
VHPVYRRHNEIVERTEVRATVRTRIGLRPRIAARLDHEHPYEVPGIIAVPIVASSPTYTDWLLEQTATEA